MNIKADKFSSKLGKVNTEPYVIQCLIMPDTLMGVSYCNQAAIKASYDSNIFVLLTSFLQCFSKTELA